MKSSLEKNRCASAVDEFGGKDQMVSDIGVLLIEGLHVSSESQRGSCLRR